MPCDGCVILTFERMRAIEPVDPDSATIVVEAGATLQSVQETAAHAGMLFPLDIGGRGSCTIGGNISTNAGGNRVLRYGMMRDLVLGLEVVLADGTVIDAMSDMLKNNAGYDLKQLFVGSEGTLGVVTKAVLRLFPRTTSVQTALCAAGDFDATLALLRLAKERLGADLSAYEVMWQDFYTFGTTRRSPRAASDRPCVLRARRVDGDRRNPRCGSLRGVRRDRARRRDHPGRRDRAFDPGKPGNLGDPRRLG